MRLRRWRGNSIMPINPNHFTLLFDKFNLQYSYAFLFGMLGAIMVFLMTHFLISPKPQLATINVTLIVDEFMKQKTGKNLSEDALKNESHLFGKKLEANLYQLAIEKHIILLPSEAVIAGAPDYTSYLKTKLSRLHDE
jgi:hypothetical protein